MVLGHEGAGVVLSVGPAVTLYKPGDRVGWGFLQGSCGHCHSCHDGWETYCPDRKMYGHADLDQGSMAYGIVKPQERLYALPQEIADEEVAPLMCAGSTVWAALEKAGAKAPQRVGVVGIGGLGHLAIQVSPLCPSVLAIVQEAFDTELMTSVRRQDGPVSRRFHLVFVKARRLPVPRRDIVPPSLGCPHSRLRLQVRRAARHSAHRLSHAALRRSRRLRTLPLPLVAPGDARAAHHRADRLYTPADGAGHAGFDDTGECGCVERSDQEDVGLRGAQRCPPLDQEVRHG